MDLKNNAVLNWQRADQSQTRYQAGGGFRRRRRKKPYRSNSGRKVSPTCKGIDFENRGVKCKHILRRHGQVMKSQQGADGTTTVTETLSPSLPRSGHDLSQNGGPTTRPQTNGKDKFRSLVSDLCTVASPGTTRTKLVRPRPLPDAIFRCRFSRSISTVSGLPPLHLQVFRRGHAERGFVISPGPPLQLDLQLKQEPRSHPILRGLLVAEQLAFESCRDGLRG